MDWIGWLYERERERYEGMKIEMVAEVRRSGMFFFSLHIYYFF